MATSLDKFENKVQIPSSVRKALSYGEKIAKIGAVYQEIFDEKRQFLAVSYLTFTNEYCQLRTYWTEFHEIFT